MSDSDSHFLKFCDSDLSKIFHSDTGFRLVLLQIT